ncbi:hypothetical protein [Halocalculus aciditolerans]|uniref:DUF7968 domain-containing protein n=1 Tax=Halocalculus aciditolerans TaxID=1383812 RepID=A0A830F7U9_9EURY|nr:hypothetical protein [Halocalculus aciditolerans]GGL47841.1 hypothetical protein GCM10009039_02600 [Halocalculus aciditolerans]
MSAANRLVLSFPGDLSEWGRDQLETRHFRAYLKRVHASAAVGDEWPVFLDVGCCGDSLDITLRVEAVDGDGDELTADTDIEYVEREPEDIEGGWEVQSRGAPETS